MGRLHYAASTMICLPTSLSQEVGAGRGAQAGEVRLWQNATSSRDPIQHGPRSEAVDAGRGRSTRSASGCQPRLVTRFMTLETCLKLRRLSGNRRLVATRKDIPLIFLANCALRKSHFMS